MIRATAILLILAMLAGPAYAAARPAAPCRAAIELAGDDAAAGQRLHQAARQAGLDVRSGPGAKLELFAAGRGELAAAMARLRELARALGLEAKATAEEPSSSSTDVICPPTGRSGQSRAEQPATHLSHRTPAPAPVRAGPAPAEPSLACQASTWSAAWPVRGPPA